VRFGGGIIYLKYPYCDKKGIVEIEQEQEDDKIHIASDKK
jgi:hypothetical protein